MSGGLCLRSEDHSISISVDDRFGGRIPTHCITYWIDGLHKPGQILLCVKLVGRFFGLGSIIMKVLHSRKTLIHALHLKWAA